MSRRRIGMVGCVKSKLDHAAPARELYTSQLFRGRRASVERTCDRWFILSALHGLVSPDEVLEPYQRALKGDKVVAKRAWAAQVLQAIDHLIGEVDDTVIELHAGSDYLDLGLADGLIERGADVERPTAGLSLGEQLRYYGSVDATFQR